MGWFKDIYDIAKAEGWVEALKGLLVRSPRILVLGSTGTGKSEVLKTLSSAELRDPIPAELRTDADYSVRVNLLGNMVEFVDTPGDYDFSESRISAVESAIRSGYDGFINVVGFGFHEYNYGGGEAQSALHPDGTPSTDWLARHQQREIEMLAEWIDLLRFAKRDPFLMTICNKADLWWQSRPKCREHYSSGDYSSLTARDAPERYSYHEFCAIKKAYYDRYEGNGSLSDTMVGKLRDQLITHLLGRVGRRRHNAERA